MKQGDIVKFKKPLEPGDDISRFMVIELRGNRVLVEDVNSTGTIKPTFVYLIDDLTLID